MISWAANNRGSLDIVLPNLTCAKRTLSLEQLIIRSLLPVAPGGGGGARSYFLGGYVPPGTPNWHPVLKEISPKIDTPF